MTNSEIYHASMHYHNLRARPGHAKQKAFWVAELRLRRAVVNHQIIMNRKTTNHRCWQILILNSAQPMNKPNST